MLSHASDLTPRLSHASVSQLAKRACATTAERVAEATSHADVLRVLYCFLTITCFMLSIVLAYNAAHMRTWCFWHTIASTVAAGAISWSNHKIPKPTDAVLSPFIRCIGSHWYGNSNEIRIVQSNH